MNYTLWSNTPYLTRKDNNAATKPVFSGLHIRFGRKLCKLTLWAKEFKRAAKWVADTGKTEWALVRRAQWTKG